MYSRLLSILFIFILSYKVYSQQFKIKLSEHNSNIETLVVSPDGKFLASGSWDGNINLYTFDSTGNPKFKTTLKGHLGAVISLSFSLNNKFLVSSSKDYSSRIWHIDTPSKCKIFKLHSQPVTASFLDPSNKYLISASLDGTIRTTNILDDKKSKVIKLAGPINDLILSKDFKYYYAAIKGGVIKKYETGGLNAEIMTFSGHTDEVNAIEISPDGTCLASASSDKTIQIWSLESGKQIKILVGFEWKVTSLKYSTDGRYIVGGCNNGISLLFDTESGKSISEFKELGNNVRDVAFSYDGKLILIATLMDAQKYGAVIYNSGVSSAAAPTIVNQKKPKSGNSSGTKKNSNGTK